MKYGFVYIWFDSANTKQNSLDKIKRWYIGYHWGGSENDGYICSSNWMRDAYRRRPLDFKRRILRTNISTKKETIEEEHKWLQFIKKRELGKRYYNLRNSKYYIKNDMSGQNNPMYGVSLIPWNKGKSGYKVKSCSEERKRKIGLANSRPMSSDHKEKLSLAHKGKISLKKGVPMKLEQREKLKLAWIKRKERLISGEEVHWTKKFSL